MTPNTQPPEKKFKPETGLIDLHSIFHTIQGEGPFTGHRSIFIRLAGCNLQCPGCDTEYTRGRTKLMPEQIISRIRELPYAKLVVITGGEPLRQNIDPLCQALFNYGYNVQIETNGVMPLSREMQTWSFSKRLTIVVSPKTHRVHPSVEQAASAYKYVLQKGNVAPDGLPIEALENKVNRRVARPPHDWDGDIYITPYDEKNISQNYNNLQTVIASSLEHGYIAGIQLHKLLEME